MKITTAEFIRRARLIHGDRYDYSRAEYGGTLSRVRIICPDHGAFEKTPNNHLYGKQGCPECGRKKWHAGVVLSHAEFIERARARHGDRYDYRLVEYKHNLLPITIVCSIHGPFDQTPNSHLYGTAGCPLCGRLSMLAKMRMSTEEFTQRAHRIHGERYDYSLVVDTPSTESVTIICRKHGPFRQQMWRHLRGDICRRCVTDAQRLTRDDLLRRVYGLFEEEYDYSLVKDGWVPTRSRIEVLCPSHGPFAVSVGEHLRGAGCPVSRGSRAEQVIARILTESEVRFIPQWRHPACRDTYPLPFDFMLPDLDALIEYDGIYHFKPVQRRGESESDALGRLIRQRQRDAIKSDWAAANGWCLIRLTGPLKRLRHTLVSAGVLASPGVEYAIV